MTKKRKREKLRGNQGRGQLESFYKSPREAMKISVRIAGREGWNKIKEQLKTGPSPKGETATAR